MVSHFEVCQFHVADYSSLFVCHFQFCLFHLAHFSYNLVGRFQVCQFQVCHFPRPQYFQCFNVNVQQCVADRSGLVVSAADYGVRGPKFESHRERLC